MKYPIYIPSKGRADICKTAELLQKYDSNFFIVIEEDEFKKYKLNYDEKHLLTIPQVEIDNYKKKYNKIPKWDLPYKRTWIKKYSEKKEVKHWQIDDNILSINSVNKGKQVKTNPIIALQNIENFIDRYSNIGISGLRHSVFANFQNKPFQLNQQVYSCVLVNNKTPYYWRNETIEDTDFSLQNISGGYCTVLFNAFCFTKPTQMKMRGGNTDSAYSKTGAYMMAKQLKKNWPMVVKNIIYKNGRPKVTINNVWSKYDTQLKRI